MRSAVSTGERVHSQTIDVLNRVHGPYLLFVQAISPANSYDLAPQVNKAARTPFQITTDGFAP